jgi:hypothetical protein
MDSLNKLNPEDEMFVDLRWKTPYFDPKYKNTSNVWEYYFQQPTGLTLDCYKQEHAIIINDELRAKTLNLFGVDNTKNKYALAAYEDRIAIGKELIRKYLKPQPHIEKLVNDFYNGYFNNKKILGIHNRGGFHYINGHAANQQHLFDYNYYFSVIDRQLDNFDNVFLICNDAETKLAFKQRYGSELITYQYDCLGTTKTFGYLHPGSGNYVPINYEGYKAGESAAIDCLLLSKCDKKLIVNSNLSLASALLNDNPYEFIDEHIIYRG